MSVALSGEALARMREAVEEMADGSNIVFTISYTKAPSLWERARAFFKGEAPRGEVEVSISYESTEGYELISTEPEIPLSTGDSIQIKVPARVTIL